MAVAYARCLHQYSLRGRFDCFICHSDHQTLPDPLIVPSKPRPPPSSAEPHPLGKGQRWSFPQPHDPDTGPLVYDAPAGNHKPARKHCRWRSARKTCPPSAAYNSDTRSVRCRSELLVGSDLSRHRSRCRSVVSADRLFGHVFPWFGHC